MPSKETLDAYEEYMRAGVMPGNLERRQTMSEIRDKAYFKICNIIARGKVEHKQIGGVTHEILSIPELAVVDREAELPSIFHISEKVISALEYKKRLKGYVKEVKDE